MPVFDWTEDTSVKEAVGQAIGYASLCWEPTPTGEFDSTRASDAVDELVEFLKGKLFWGDNMRLQTVQRNHQELMESYTEMERRALTAEAKLAAAYTQLDQAEI